MISLKNLSLLWHISAFPTWCPVMCFKSRTQWRFLNSKSHLKSVFYVSSFQNIRNWHIWELNILQGMVLLLKSNISWSTGNMLRKEAASHKMVLLFFSRIQAWALVHPLIYLEFISWLEHRSTKVCITAGRCGSAVC